MTVPPEEAIDCLVEDRPGVVEPVRWSEYLPDGLLADLLAGPADTDVSISALDAGATIRSNKPPAGRSPNTPTAAPPGPPPPGTSTTPNHHH